MNKKLFEHVTFGNHIPMLDLISKTTATAGLKINTDPATPNNDLEICDKTGQKCFNISSDNDNLYIYPKGTARADAPFKIVAAAGTPGSKAYASITVAPSADGGGGGSAGGGGANTGKISTSSSSLTTAITFATKGTGYIGHNAAISYSGGGGGSGFAIGNIMYDSSGGIESATITNSGTGYTSPPTVTIAGGTAPTSSPVRFYATASTAATAVSSFTLATVPDTGAIASSLPLVTPNNGYYSSPTKLVNNVQTSIVTIANNSKRAGAVASTDANGFVTSITIKNLMQDGSINTAANLELDNGYYIAGNVRIVSINGVNFGTNLEFDATVNSSGTLTAITPKNNLGATAWTGFGSASQNNLVVILSAPETADIATITPSITNGSITSLTLDPVGSKYYKPTISVSNANLVTPGAATMPALHKLS